jgi:hypothetical protein
MNLVDKAVLKTDQMFSAIELTGGVEVGEKNANRAASK